MLGMGSSGGESGSGSLLRNLPLVPSLLSTPVLSVQAAGQLLSSQKRVNTRANTPGYLPPAANPDSCQVW